MTYSAEFHILHILLELANFLKSLITFQKAPKKSKMDKRIEFRYHDRT